MMSKRVVILLGAMCVLPLLAAPATATVVTGDAVDHVKTYSLDNTKFPQQLGGFAFDPSYRNGSNNYDRVFLCSRTASTATRGLYWTTISDQFLSERIAVTDGNTGGTNRDPTDVVLDSAGTAYVAIYTSPSVQKVENPTGTFTKTAILTNYLGTADDDPMSLDAMPAGFGLEGYGEGDFLLLDNGVNCNDSLTDGVIAFKGDGSKTCELLWSKTETTDHYYRGAGNSVDKKFYFADAAVMPTVNVEGTNYPAIYRIGGNKVLETVAMSLPSGVTFTQVGAAVAVNPHDGSIWVAKKDELWGTNSVIRVDVMNAVDKGGSVFLASATEQIAWDIGENFDCGYNSMAWSPDGKYLVVGSFLTTLTDQKLAVFVDDSIVIPPEIPGDADRDGKVEADDAQALAANWGAVTGATWQMGDFNKDGAVSAADASILAANWHYGMSESTTVPEPAMLALLLAGALALLARLR